MTWTRPFDKSGFQFAAIGRATPLSMLGHVINVTITLVAFHGAVPSGPLALWAVASYAVAAWILFRAALRARRKARVGAAQASRSQPSTRKSVIFGALLAAPWGVLAFWLFGELPQQQELILIALCVGMSASGSVLLSAIYPAAVTYMACILVPVALKCFLLDGHEYLLLGALTLSFVMFLLNVISSCARLFADKERAVEELSKSLIAAESAQREIEHAAMHDALTGLPNRRAFMTRTLSLNEGDKATRALFYFDLDGFKPINDAFGHGAGDKLLQSVGSRLAACAQEGDFIARLGGDEFTLLAGNIATQAGAEARAVALLDTLCRPHDIDGNPITVGASIGVVMEGDVADTTQMLKMADLALYKAKRSSGPRYCVFRPSMLRELEARQTSERALRVAVEGHQLELHYQPVVELKSQNLVGAEALIRWRHPDRGLISPGEFLPLAEEMQLLNTIEIWVLEEACRQAALWPEHLTIAVNVSPSLVVHTEIAATVARILSATGLQAPRLELEVTESAILNNDVQTRRKLSELKALGVSLAMDDFGTGYSSLAYLSRFPFDRIKIDRSFVEGLREDSGSALIVRATTDMARSLGLRTTAEGVETELQLRMLQELGIELGQGYLFSKPLPARELPVLFLRGLAPHSSRGIAATH